MRAFPILYGETETTFENNGIGVLQDAVSCIVTEQRNGIYELLMQYPASGLHFGEIACRSIITAKPAANRDPQPFRVYKITKPMNGVVSIYAQHISYDLAGVVAEPFTADSAAAAMAKLQTDTFPQNPFEMWTDKETVASMKNTAPASVRSKLGGTGGSILDVYGGELEFDGYTVKLWNSRGQSNGVEIRYGKNLTSVKQDENCANVRTGIYPYWLDQNSGEMVTLPEKVVEAPGTYTFTNVLAVDMTSAFKEKPTVDQIRHEAQSYVRRNQIGIPKVSLSVSYVSLDQSEEYKDSALLERVNLCDTVSVVFPAMGVHATAKVVKTVYNVLLGRMDKVEIGNAKANIADTIATQAAELAKVPTESVMKSLAMQAAASVLGANGGAVRMLDTNDDGMPDTLYIADDPDPTRATKVWRWNYAGWAASENGYNGPFTMAASLETGLVADFITAGTLNASLIKAGTISSNNGNVSMDLDAGSMAIKKGNINLGNGNFVVNDAGYLTSKRGSIGGMTINDNRIYNDAVSLHEYGMSINNGNGETVGSFTSIRDILTGRYGVNMLIEDGGAYTAWSNHTPEMEMYKLMYTNSPIDDNLEADCVHVFCGIDQHYWPTKHWKFENGTHLIVHLSVINSLNSDGTVASYTNARLKFTYGVLTSFEYE